MNTLVSIDDLPDEILQFIFSQLPWKDRGTVTQVCQRWFSLGFRLSEIVLKVDLDRFKDDHSQLDVILASQRAYQHATLNLGLGSSNYEPLLSILAKFCADLRTLNLQAGERTYPINYSTHINSKADKFALENLQSLRIHSSVLSYPGFNIQSLMPNLSELHISVGRYSNKLAQVLNHFRDQLTTLGLRFQFTPNRRPLNIPELEVQSKRHFFGALEQQFPRLTQITFRVAALKQFTPELKDAIISFFRHNPTLEQVFLESNVCASILQTIVTNCVNIGYLSLNTYSLEEQSNCLTCIANMKHLQRLRLEYINLELLGQVNNYPVLGSLRSLTLSNVTIPDPDQFNRFLAHNYPNLSSLELLQMNHQTRANGAVEFLSTICNGLSRLQRLVVTEPKSIPIDSLLQCLPTLTNLRELRLGCQALGEFGMETIRMSSLRCLAISAHINDPGSLVRLLKSVPNLQKLELDRHSDGLVDEIRKAVPGCDAYVNPKMILEEL